MSRLEEVLATDQRVPEASRTLNSSIFTESTGARTLTVALGANGSFDAGSPVLMGPARDDLFPTAIPAGQSGDLGLFRSGEWRLGAATVPVDGNLEDATRRIYMQVFGAARGLHLARIWNYVPAINETGPGNLENYRAFCRGRSLAFEEQFGSGFNAVLPAASAVGRRAGALTVVFAASPFVPRHVENPLQVAAYDYPPDYGPRSPSFARATIVPAKVETTAFISGTAAIRGHGTVAPNDIRGQLECTIENLREISITCGLGPDMDRGGGSARHFKVYLRNAADRPFVAARLEEAILKPSDRIVYLHAGICRAELVVEIESTLFGVSGAR